MSKIIAISGNHYRHFHVFSEVNKVFPLAGHIIVQRENIIPVPPANTSPRDAKNFELHFKNLNGPVKINLMNLPRNYGSSSDIINLC